MSMEIIRKAVESQLKKDVPSFAIGDTVDVSVRIVEGDKERIQLFSGTVIARRGHGMGEYFTVRRIVNNEGVERTFPLHSPRWLASALSEEARYAAPSCTTCAIASARRPG